MFLACTHFFDDKMLLAVVLTLVISFISFSSIRVLDLIADMDCTGQKTDKAIIQIIKAIGILVGFGWEQCFDEAVESISAVMPQPHVAKMFLALFCVAVIVPAWKWYLLPMAIQEGWKFGFVVDDTKPELGEAIHKLRIKKGSTLKNNPEFLALRTIMKMETMTRKKSSECVEDAHTLPLPPGYQWHHVTTTDQEVQVEPALTQLEATSLSSLTTPLLNSCEAPPVMVPPATKALPQYTQCCPVDAFKELHSQLDKLELLTQNFVGTSSNGDV